MFCYNCGKEIKDNTNFCPECGADLKGNSATNKTNTNNSLNGKPVQIVIPSVNGANIHSIKMFVVKLVFLAIAIITFVLSKDDLFTMEDKYYAPFNVWKGYSVSEITEFMEREIEAGMYDERGMETSVFDEEYSETDLTLLHIGKWCAVIAPILYVAAAIMAFLNVETFAHVLNFIGTILNIVFIILISMSLKLVLELDSIMDVTEHVTNLMWWYLALCMAIFIISRIFFWGAETAKTYEGKTYSLLEKAGSGDSVSSSTNVAKDSWRCSECNKINPGYCGTCSCGNSKK